MSELVRDQLPPFRPIRPKLIFGEIDVPPHGKRSRPELRAEPGGVLIGVDTHSTEIRPEARFHESQHVAW
jgi:hypothetical protein